MQNEKKKIRSEYLYAALMCIAVALVIVILIVCGSCEPDVEGSGAESAASSAISVPGESEMTQEVSSEESVPTAFCTIEVPSAGKLSGSLALTNLPADGASVAEPEGLLSIYAEQNGSYALSGNSLRLHSDAIEALNEFAEAFEDAKGENNLIVDKAYTADVAENGVEADLTNGYTLMFSVWPVDPDGDYLGSGKFLWLADNCNSFGYILRYPAEKTEFTHVSGTGTGRVYRYVGYEHAAHMGKYHLCLEEYLDAVRSFTSELPLEITYKDASGDERVCSVYYVPASEGETTELPIRGGENTDYSISGNGTDGFVVTCYLS